MSDRPVLTDTGCRLCPRGCGADRAAGEKGFCQVAGTEVLAARAGLHMWEEPCISGKSGSGTVFFSGCVLRCVYCQNYVLANARAGVPISEERLAEVFLELQEKGAANINLVTPTHYTPQIIRAVKKARGGGLRIPIVYNCGGYEKKETLACLEGVVDIYLTDFKYMDSRIAAAYSRAADYPQVAKAALEEMVRQQPVPRFDGDGMMQKGVIVRHLLLPGHTRSAMEVIRYVHETYGGRVYLSLMNQYTPLPHVKDMPGLNRRVTKREYEKVVDHAIALGVENAFIQEGETALESFIPAFDGEGL